MIANQGPWWLNLTWDLVKDTRFWIMSLMVASIDHFNLVLNERKFKSFISAGLVILPQKHQMSKDGEAKPGKLFFCNVS